MQNAPEELWADELQDAVTPPPQPWGFWATLGWFALAAVLYLGMQIVLAFAAVASILVGIPLVGGHAEDLPTNGLVLAATTFIGNAATLSFLLLPSFIRRCRIRDWFALRPLRARQTVIALAIAAVFIVASDLTTHLLGKPLVPEFMVNAWKTAGFLPLLLAALIVAAPVFEEMAFRGFLFQGIARLRWGGIPAIIVTAALWAGMHMQYDWYGVGTLFIFGLLLGSVRLWTGSVTLPILMHAAVNVVASVETFVVVDGMK